jgi:hypothetical protein
MLNLTVLVWLSLIAALASFWWQSDAVKIRALKLASDHCKNLGVQFLDQSMVINGLWPIRDVRGSLRLRRRYGFEFTSTGEERYQGVITMAGKYFLNIELDAHIIP